MKRTQLKESDLRRLIKKVIINEASANGTLIYYARSCQGSTTYLGGVNGRCWENPTGNPIQVGDVLKITGPSTNSQVGRHYFAKDVGGPCSNILIETSVGGSCPNCCHNPWHGAGNSTPSGACVAACNPPQRYACNNGSCIPHPNGQYPTLNDCQRNCGEDDQCQCCSRVPAGTCSSYNSTYLSNCQVAPAQGSIHCGGTSIDCTQHGVDNVDQTTGANPGGYFDPQGVNAIANGNCNPIQNKINQGCKPNWSQEKCDCRMDHLNFLLTLCQANSGNVQVSQTFINSMTNHYNNQGCYGNQGSQSSPHPNSVCGKKNSICPGSTAMKQAKCNWLTTFTSNNNCNC